LKEKKTKRVFFFEAPVDLSRLPLSQSGGGPSPFSVDPTWVGLGWKSSKRYL